MKKKTFIPLLFLAGTLGVFAQKEECQLKASVYVEAAKLKNYDNAYEPWKYVYEHCPELYQSTFQYGERILRDKITKGADKDKYVKDLQDLYENYYKYFPQKFSLADKNIRQAFLLVEQNKGTRDQLFELLDQTYKIDKDAFSDDTQRREETSAGGIRYL